MGTYHVLASCMLLYVSLTCNLMQNYYKKKKAPTAEVQVVLEIPSEVKVYALVLLFV